MMLATLLQMDMGSGPSDTLEHAYFWVGAFIALFPVIVFGTIGFFAIRTYFRDRATKPEPLAGSSGAMRG